MTNIFNNFDLNRVYNESNKIYKNFKKIKNIPKLLKLKSVHKIIKKNNEINIYKIII